MVYNKQEGKYLTARVNDVFSELSRLSKSLKKKESGLTEETTIFVHFGGPSKA
jgi:hypothetical protein